ncbi:alpha/beta fold hydrolase [Halegenticoccus tardaugens]|uniref:alpha/beta fold hydrolase n=1 Tax=Halegenticoccus tardaugens TaxID=2071624 RepID=UPI00100AAAC6|nr:alpha/beta fold hydrolase [Halegenticoccus tardaugens]
MPTIRTNDVETYYERRGEGRPLVCVHGAWTDHRLWKPQVDAFGDDYEVIAYDVRGHGRTGPSAERRYSVELFAADLRALVEGLELDRPIVCGLSLGGMIAQTYAVRYADDLRALVLADTAVSSAFTRRDRATRLLFPGWAMRGIVRLLGPPRYVDVAYWLAERTRGKEWFGRDEAVRSYVRETMSSFEASEFNKIFRAIYDFRRVDLASIRVPTLVLNGEHESRAVFRHAAYVERTIPDVRSAVVSDAGHVANLENPEAFNREVSSFLSDALDRRSVYR